MPLKILLVVDSYFPAVGGTERQLAQLAPRFSELGHNVEILCAQLRPNDPVRDQISGVPVRRIAFPRIWKLGSVVMHIKLAWVLWREYRHFDVIHVHIVHNMAPVVGALRPFLRGMLVAKISGATEMTGGLLDPKNSKSLRFRVRNYFVRKFDYFQVISSNIREAMIHAGYDASKLIGIPNGVILSRFSEGNTTRAPELQFSAVYAGRLACVKGVDVLLRAWAKVVAQFPARLIILGDGPELENLQSQAEELGISANVEFAGDCPDIAPYLAQSDIYIQPSRAEGLSNSVIEAMAAGLPIVATQVGGNGDLVVQGKSGLLVQPESPDDLATAICSLFSDAVATRKMGKVALDHVVQQYAINSVVARLNSLYSGVLPGRASL